MNKDELVVEIGRALAKDRHISSRPWRQLAIVVQYLSSSTKVNGFAYQDDGKAIPTGPRELDVLKRFEALRVMMHEGDKPDWKACLVRIEQPSGKISIDFEYDNPEKWLITPNTVKVMAETLRPQ